jgi:hypothetical protein
MRPPPVRPLAQQHEKRTRAERERCRAPHVEAHAFVLPDLLEDDRSGSEHHESEHRLDQEERTPSDPVDERSTDDQSNRGTSGRDERPPAEGFHTFVRRVDADDERHRRGLRRGADDERERTEADQGLCCA